jgi:predicted amidophosphoribosyltransferase
VSRALAEACGSLVDLILPRRCVQCGRAGGWLCAGCRSELKPLGDSACARCGAPARRPVPVCRECRGRELAFDAAAAAYVYDGPARRMVTVCKFRALRSLTAEMAALAAGRFEAVLVGRAVEIGRASCRARVGVLV